MSIVNFTTRIQNYSSTAIDNVFIGSSRREHISIEPVINGLSIAVVDAFPVSQTI
jgi:hypothetical protein